MHRKSKATLTALAVAALAYAGVAAAAGSLTVVRLQGGQSTKIGKTKVMCLRKTVTVTRTVTTPPVTVTVTTTPAVPASVAVDFSGDGSLSEPPFTTSRGETLSWTYVNGNGDFPTGMFIDDVAASTVVVDSQATSGSSYLPPGTHQFSVTTVGTWTIHVS